MRGDVTGGSFPLTGDLTLTRMGFGAMQLAGPGVWGRPVTAAPRSACCVPLWSSA
jgi:hypothetical protein